MRAEIKSVHSPDVWDLETWVPDSIDFSVLIQLLVGPEGEDGEESFDLLIRTPGWLAEQAEKDGIVDGRHIYIVTSWDWLTIRNYLESRVRDVEAANWESLSVPLGRIGKWEFEDYREHPE